MLFVHLLLILLFALRVVALGADLLGLFVAAVYSSVFIFLSLLGLYFFPDSAKTLSPVTHPVLLFSCAAALLLPCLYAAGVPALTTYRLSFL